MNIQEVCAVVSGGASGLGEAAARMLAAHGARVTIADLDEERGRRIQAELGTAVQFIRTDICSEEDIGHLLDGAEQHMGCVNAVLNCAGVAHAEKVAGRSVHSLSAFMKVLEVNAGGTFNMIRLAVPYMQKNNETKEGERGIFINTASVAAFEGQIGQAAYSASKGAVASMTLPLARELARYGIRVTAIAPGLFETPMFAGLPEAAKEGLAQMTPFPRRLGRPEEYAALAVHMIENVMLNGEVVRLDGAIRMQPK